MVDFTQEDFKYYVDRVDTLLHRFTGHTTGGGGGGGGDDTKSRTVRQKFETGVRAATESLKTLHGSASNAAYSLQRVVGYGAFGAAITGLVSGITEMSRTYSKLSDVGVSFGGSMFQMQQQAGNSGLTLEQFAQQVTKSSVVVASMSASQVKGTTDFNAYQKVVRSSLKQFGYYGLSLSQLTEVSAEYADTLLQTGQWQNRDKEQRAEATTSFIKAVSGLAAATGKSRDAIIKQTIDAMKSPAIASMMNRMTEQQKAMAPKYIAMMYATMGQAGGDAFKELVTTGGRAQFTAAGQANIGIGLGALNSVNEKIYQEMMAGKDISLDTLQQQKNMATAIQERDEAGGFDALYMNPANRAAIDAARALAQQWRGVNAETRKAIMDREKARKDDPATIAIQNFETNLTSVTASLREGFYKGIVKFMGDATGGFENFEDTLKTMNKMFENFGKVAGSIFALLLDVIPVVVTGFNLLAIGLKGVQWFLEKMLTPLEKLLQMLGIGAGGELVYEPDALGKDAIDKETGQKIPVWKKAKKGEKQDEQGNLLDESDQKVQERTQPTAIAKILSSALTVGLAGLGVILAKRWLNRIMKIEARTVHINTGNVIGGGIGGIGGSGGGGPGGGAGGPGGAGAPKGRMARWFGSQSKFGGFAKFMGYSFAEQAAEAVATEAGVGVRANASQGRMARWFGQGSKLRAGAGFLTRGLVGYMAGELANVVIDQLPDSATKDAIEKIIPWASMGLSLLGPQIAQSLMSVIGKKVAGNVVTSATETAATTAAATAGEGASASAAKATSKGRMARWFGAQSKFGGFARFMGYSVAEQAAETVATEAGAGVRANASQGRLARWFGQGSKLSATVAAGAGGMLKSGITGLGSLFKGGLGMGAILTGGGGLLKVVFKGIIGGLVSLLVEPFLNLFGNFKGKNSLISMANYAGYGAMIGSFIPVIGTAVGAIVGGFIGLIVENFDGILGSIGDLIGNAWDGAKWVGRVVVGMFDWIGNQFEKLMPAWFRNLIGYNTKSTPPTATTEAPVSQDVQKMFASVIPEIANMIQPMLYSDPSLRGNADTLIKALGAVTPAVMAETMKLVEADPTHSFLTAPVKDTDTFEMLNTRLLELTALKGLDEQKRARGDATQKTLDEIAEIMKKEHAITNALLHRGNSLQRDANQAADQRQMFQ